MEYERIIKRALNISWRHKVLWVFGIAAAVFGGAHRGPRGEGSGIQYILSSGDIERWQRSLPRVPWCPIKPWAWQGMPFPEWSAMAPVLAGLVAVALIVAFLALIVGIVVRFTSLGALVGMVDEVERTEKTSFKSGLAKGWANLLRLFALNLIIGLAVFLVVVALILLGTMAVALASVPAILLFQAGTAPGVAGILWAVAVGLGLLLVSVLVGLAVAALTTLVREFAFRACVIDGQGIFDALRAGVALVRNRPREAVLTWLLLLANPPGAAGRWRDAGLGPARIHHQPLDPDGSRHRSAFPAGDRPGEHRDRRLCPDLPLGGVDAGLPGAARRPEPRAGELVGPRETIAPPRMAISGRTVSAAMIARLAAGVWPAGNGEA